MSEREPAPRRTLKFNGDQRHQLDENGPAGWRGPDSRGLFWRACHADYDLESNLTRMIFKPVPITELHEHAPHLINEQREEEQ